MNDEGRARVKAVYADNYDRLATLQKYDAISLLRLGQNIRPSLWAIATVEGRITCPFSWTATICAA
jgi:hypothetical protein